MELRELLDPEVIVETGRRLQWLDGHRVLRDAEDALELLRQLGDLTAAEAIARGATQEWLDDLVATRRAIMVRVAGEERYIVAEDAKDLARIGARVALSREIWLVVHRDLRAQARIGAVIGWLEAAVRACRARR